MDLNLVIPTRNNCTKVARLIESLSESNQKLSKVFFISDSTNFREKEKLRRLCSTYKNLETELVDNREIKSKKIPLKLKKIFRLGVSEWNLPNARNIGVLYSYLFSGENANTFFLDDDMVVPKDFALTLKGNKNQLLKINIQGCPDLSRLEWIQLYIKANNPEAIISSDYVSSLYNEIRESSIDLLGAFTTLINNPNNPEATPRFSARDELSGGAFACSNNLFRISAFPNWFDEDWFWFYKVRETAKIQPSKCKSHLFHRSEKKDIINQKLLLFEEHGKILTNCAKDAISTDSDNNKIKNIILERRSERVRLLKEIIRNLEIRRTLTAKNNQIKKSLEKTMYSIEKQQIQFYKVSLNSFIAFNNSWCKLFEEYIKLNK